MKVLRARKILLIAGTLLGIAASALGQELTELYYQSFDDGKIEGVFGKAGPRISVDARDKIDLDRGTIAFFYKSETPPQPSEWNGPGGIDSFGGYWGMLLRFDMRRLEFLFNFYDVGFYCPPLKFEPVFGRWQAGQWHHLAAVWDRHEGITIYEDGKRVRSNWGKYRREWNGMPDRLSLSGPIDELHIFAVPLTDAQIAQLARGERPTGAPMPLTSEAERRPFELARMGWSGASLTAMPVVKPGELVAMTFARINRCIDARRPVAYPFEGLLYTTWPSIKYGASVRGQRLEIMLDKGSSYDHVRVFTHRPFSGELVRLVGGEEKPLVRVETPHAMFWNAKLPGLLSDQQLVLKRAFGQLGQIDFYRVESLSTRPAALKSYFFIRASGFPENDLGKTLQAETPVRYRQPLLATTKEPQESWVLHTPAFGGFQACTEPLDEAQAFDGVLVELLAEGITEPTPIRLEFKEPIFADRVWLAADVVLQPKGAGRNLFTLLLRGKPIVNMPSVKERKYLKDGKYEEKGTPIPGASFGIKLTTANPIRWIMGRGGCVLHFVRADLAQSLPIVVSDQVEWMREAYAEVMEGHHYSSRWLVTPMRWLAIFAPERMEFRQMYERIGSPQWFEGMNIPKLVYPAPKNDTGAPDWAFWQMQALKEHKRLIHWYIDNMQVETGEFGGIWNDDTDHVENWFCHALAMDEDGKIADAIRRFLDGNWMYQLDHGVGKYAQDPCHFYEEGMGTQAMRVLMDYGDPVAVERCMAAASHYEKWLKKMPDGTLRFRSGFFSVNGIWGGPFEIESPGAGHDYDLLIPAAYLIWYNRHPAAAAVYRGLKRGAGLHGSAYDRVTDFEAAKKMYAEEMVKPVGRYGPADHLVWFDEVGLTDEAQKIHFVEYAPPGPIAHYWGSRDCDLHWFRFKISGDVRWLVDSWKRVCEWFYSHDWLNTAAMPSMDRNPLPRGSLIRARLGGLVANRGAASVKWPTHGLSYGRGGDNVAAIVTENLPHRLQVRLYPFNDKPHELQIRVWRLNGLFRVRLFNDRNDDGQPEETIWEKEMHLDRGAYIDLLLPPRQASILSIAPIRVDPTDFDKPDPAISRGTVELVYGDHLVVKVHNLGTKPVEDVLVRVRDARSGEIVVDGEQHTGPIEAPLDLRPRFKGVEFKNINANTYGAFIIEIDPENKIDDLNRYNNRLLFQYRSTFSQREGWH